MTKHIDRTVDRKGTEAKASDTAHDIQLQEFSRYLMVQNLSPNTIRSYLFAVRQFFQFYPQLTYPNLQLYKLYLLEHYKPQTVNLRIHGLNSFLAYLEWPNERLMQVRIQRKAYLDQIISEGDYEYLKSRLLQDRNYLYYFLIRFMAATGARVSEVIQFTAEDIAAGYKDIYSKDNKVRRIYIPALLQADTWVWLRQTGRLSGDIFLSRSGKRITARGVRGQLKSIARQYHLDEQVMYPHSFRHRFAKNFIESCSNISLLSNLLGHESIETTRIYLQRSSSEQKAIINEVVDW
ncbi:MAG: tyrosine-type recombinase/integrase [Lachnospiraceae bacterium]|nr:tyrosine-type recombinase/integrase [Lachnospiraceae bacterium]